MRRETGLSKERRGGGTEGEGSHPERSLTHSSRELPWLRAGHSMAPRTHPALVGFTQCGQKMSASQCDEGSDHRRPDGVDALGGALSDDSAANRSYCPSSQYR